ncbi:MAG: DEAD/DEAH box helicase family protein, partial [Lysobacterales bacterium]
MGEAPQALVLHVALPVPVPHGFDYAGGSHGSVDANWVGCRVRVRFGPRSLIGIVVAIRPDDGAYALREIEARLDASPLLHGELWQSLHWAAQYYAHPLGEVLASALPVWLRRNECAPARVDAWLTLTDAGRSALRTKPVRPQTAAAQLWEALREDGAVIARSARATTAAMTRVMRQWRQRGWLMAAPIPGRAPAPQPGPTLNPAQRAAVVAVQEQRGFATFVLAGVTGSGKTEVYLQLIKAELDAGRQSLVLVPEIGLTP